MSVERRRGTTRVSSSPRSARSPANDPVLDSRTRRRLRRAGRQLVEWFAESRRDFVWRRDDADIYTKVLAEVLLQRTTARAASDFMGTFIDRYPSWAHLAEADVADLEDALQPLGLQRRRARALRALAETMVAEGGFPSSRAELETWPAVGQYVASAVLLFEHGMAEPLLDTNMARVLERFERPRSMADIRADPFLQEASRVLVAVHPVATNWAVLDLGALVCRPRRPLCNRCPLQWSCHRVGVEESA